MFYELAVYNNNKKMLFRFRDSLNLLSGKLSSLARNLCHALGSKGSIQYDKVTPENLSRMNKRLVRLYEARYPVAWRCNAKSTRDMLEVVHY